MSKSDLTAASDQLAQLLKTVLGDRADDPAAISEFGQQQILLGGKLLQAAAPELLSDVARVLLRMAQKVVLAVPGYERQAQELVAASAGKLVLGEQDRKRFTDGQDWLAVKTPLMGREVVIVGATMTRTDHSEMCRMSRTARMSGARKITLLITYYGTARQERQQVFQESIDGLHDALELAAAGPPDEVLLVDIHDNTIVGFFQGAKVYCRNIDILPKLIHHVGTNYFDGKKCLAASPDAGRGKLVWKAAKKVNWDFAIASKYRSATSGATETAGLIGNVRGRNVMTCDDIGNSLGSAKGVGYLLKRKRAKRSVLVITHAAIPDVKFVHDFFETGLFEALFFTDSLKGAYELAEPFPGRAFVIPTAPLLVSEVTG